MEGIDGKETTMTLEIPCDYTARVQAANGNPVAVALEFQALIENVMTHLIGCKINLQNADDSGIKKTYYFKSKEETSTHHKGVFGYVTAFFGCIETQKRGALHFHVLCEFNCVAVQ